jgi:hypothetical protein
LTELERLNSPGRHAAHEVAAPAGAWVAKPAPHCSHELCPDAAWYLPAAHKGHDVAALLFEAVPAAQSLQALLPASAENFPGEHARHFSAAVPEKVPAEHASHCCTLVAAPRNVPGLHAVQEVALSPRSVRNPVLHVRHLPLSAAGAYVPYGHGTHSSLFFTNSPGLQGEQNCLVGSDKRPAGHRRHDVAPVLDW